MSRKPAIYAHQTFWKNLEEVVRLVEIHEELSGTGRGYKHRVEVLNKSAIVLLVACWESFVEDLAESAFSIILSRATDPMVFPNNVLAMVAKSLRENKNDTFIWKLAGDGWKSIMKSYKLTVFQKYTGTLNTAKTAQVDGIYASLIGLKKLSSHWHWRRMSSKNATNKLDALISLRGDIAHRVAAAKRVTKGNVKDYTDFVNRIAVETSNAVRDLINKQTKKDCWPSFTYESIFAR